MKTVPNRLIILMATVFRAVTLFAGGTDSSSASPASAVGTIEADGLKFLRGAGYIFSAPGRWDGGDWLALAGAGAGTAASSGLDIDGRLFMQKHQTSGNTRISRAAEQYGAGLNLVALSAGGYIAGLALGDRWIRETSLLAGSAILVAASLSTVTKIMVGRARPYTGRGHMAFKPFSFALEDFSSFPSGHVIVAFAFSGVLAERIHNPWASLGLYGIAASCGLSRMYTDEHWFSDVVFGAIISVSVSRSLVRWFESDADTSAPGGLSLIPGTRSLTLIWTF